MAIVKTITETGGSYKSTWTLTIPTTAVTANDSTVTIPFPSSVTAKYVYSTPSNKNGGWVRFHARLDGETVSANYAFFEKGGLGESFAGNDSKMVSGTTYTVPYKSGVTSRTINTSSIFNSNNPTSKTHTIDLKLGTGVLESAKQSDMSDMTYDGYYNFPNNTWTGYLDNGLNVGTYATITLDAPPQLTLGTPTYATPQYAGLGTYSVPLTTLTAQYGGNITSVTLTVGGDSTTQTYSSNTVSNQTISVTPSVAGSYTPTLTVTDSRGQTTTTTFTAITVNAYAVPSLNFDVFRSNSSGIKDDEGAYGLITATVNFTDAIATLTQPTVTIDGTITNNVTWYSAYNSSTGIASTISDWSAVSSGDTIYGLINGSFSGSQSYVIGITVTDSEGGNSQTITQTLSTAFYTIDFQAGGKEIAFGAPANDNLTSYPDGLFKCDMDVIINGDAKFNGDLTAVGDATLTTGDTEIQNPYFTLNTSASPGTTDGDLYAAITVLGWQSDVIV